MYNNEQGIRFVKQVKNEMIVMAIDVALNGPNASHCFYRNICTNAQLSLYIKLLGK